MPIISTWPIRTSEQVFAPGVLVFLDEETEAALVASGHATWVDVPETDTHTFPSPESFAKLSAADQKEHLLLASLEPASKADERLEQYTSFYNEQVKGDEF